MEGSKACCFTGHRPQKLPFRYNEQDARCIRLKAVLQAEIEKQITQNEVTHFISGMAIGVDMYAAEIVLSLKKRYPYITLEAAIPCETQAARWSAALRDRYFRIAELCDKETLLQHHYDAACMHKRNRYMVDNASVVIAVWDGTPSGTGKTVQYACENGKTVIVIDPLTMCVSD